MNFNIRTLKISNKLWLLLDFSFPFSYSFFFHDCLPMYPSHVTSSEGGLSLHRGIWSWGVLRCHSAWKNRLNVHFLLQDCVCGILSSVELFSVEKLCQSDVFVKKHYQKTCSTQLYIAPRPESFLEIFIACVRQLLWQTNSFLFSKKEIMAFIWGDLAEFYARLIFVFFFLWVSSVTVLKTWVCDLPHNNPLQSLPELGCGRRRCTWWFSSSCS